MNPPNFNSKVHKSDLTASLEARQARFAHKVGAHLSLAAEQLPYGVAERLRASREQALTARKPASAVVLASGGAASLALAGDGGWWRQLLGSALPVLALVAGLWFLHAQPDDASDVAEIDLAILKDQLPPAAYADAGFLEFLKATKDD